MFGSMTISKARLFAAIGLLFWALYIWRFSEGFPRFLAQDGQAGLLGQLAFGAYGYLTLVVGVALGTIYRHLSSISGDDRKSINIRDVIGQSFRHADFWMAMFASPVVYAILLPAVDLETISAAAIFSLTLIGLQNGFVCNALAESLFKDKKVVKPN